MPKAIKWILAVLAALLVLLVVVIIITPMLIDLNRFKPQIVARIEKATGRPASIGGPIEPSIFPWVGLALSDLHLGNPTGFKADDFVSVDAFEIRVKLLPLLSRHVEIKRFVIKDPEIILIKRKDGRTNWEGLGGDRADTQPAKEEKQPAGGLPVEKLAVEEFAITDGLVTYIDQAADTRHEIKNINLTTDNLSLETPVDVSFSAIANNYPLSLTGTIGPIGREPGKDPVALDLTARLIDEIAVHLKGHVQNAASAPEFDMAVEVEPFSPRQALDKLNQPLPIQPSDDQVLRKVAVAFAVSGSPQSVAIKDGRIILDDSQMTFSARAKDFDKPDVVLEAALDRIDLDRYLPPPAKEEQPAEKETKPLPSEKPIDYTPLRKLVFDGRIKVGELKAKNLRMQNIQVHATAQNGVIRLVPLNMDLYDGRLAAEGTVNVQQEKPRTRFKLDMGGVQAGPLLKDYLQKERITGVLHTDINLNFTGDQAETIRRTLDGSGKLEFVDGAIIGIDLAAMVRNVQAAFGLAERPEEKPRTDFTEFVLPFSVNSGKITIQDSRLQSPLLRVQTQGSADLVQEKLNLRVEPKFVGSLIGQGDTQQQSGIMVPVNVTGSFGDPKFKPDVKSIVQQLPQTKALQEGAEKELEKTKQKVQTEIEQKAQELLKGFPFGSKPRQAPKE